MEYANNAAKMPLAETARRIRNVGNLPGTLMPPRKMKKKKHTHTHTIIRSVGQSLLNVGGACMPSPPFQKLGNHKKKRKKGFAVYMEAFLQGDTHQNSALFWKPKKK